MQMESEFDIAQPPERVFDYLADITNEAKWNPWAKTVERITPDPIAQGSRFRGSYKRFGTVVQELTDFERPKHLTYHSDAMGNAELKFELNPSAGGTSVRILGEAHPPGPMRLLEPLMRRMMVPHLHDMAAGIKRQLESES